MSEENKEFADGLKFDAKEVAGAFAYIEEKWPQLTRRQTVDDGTSVGLPYPFIMPSVANETGFSFQEMYYWDTYFIAQGLLTNGHNELAAGLLENLIFLARRFHIIPNASRSYHTNRSQPPFLTSFILEIYDKQKKNLHWLNARMHVAELEYHKVWTATEHPNWRNVFEGLSRYYEINLIDHLAETESGWDMNTRFKGKSLSYIPIDLNCLLYKYEVDFARWYKLKNEHDTASVWREKAKKRAEKVTEHLWSEDDGFFFDFDYITYEKSDVWSLAAYYSLWSGLATNDQARQLVDNLDVFIHEGGLATSRSPDEYLGDTPTQWAYPNGWAPLHWIVVEGLAAYGYPEEAETIARLWLNNNLEHFQKNGVFREAYNAVNPDLPPKPGLYPPQTGFGWTNAVFVDLAKKYLSKEELQLV